jgi:hypothetical protein
MFDQQIKAHCRKWEIYCLIPHSAFANRHGAALISAQRRTFGSIPNRDSFPPPLHPEGKMSPTLTIPASIRTPAAQYVRMSTEEQRYSIENQKQAIRQDADQHGFEVARTYEDVGKAVSFSVNEKG